MGTRSDGKEPPFLLGDGMNLWPYISGAIGNSTRTEMVHEAHTHGSTDGNGNALRVGDWKIVLRTGGQWSTGSHFVSSHKRSVFVCDVGIYSDKCLWLQGSNDGWYGGPESTDTKTGAYGVKTGNKDEDWFVK